MCITEFGARVLCHLALNLDQLFLLLVTGRVWSQESPGDAYLLCVYDLTDLSFSMYYVLCCLCISMYW